LKVKTNNVTYILLQLCDVFVQTQHSILKQKIWHTNALIKQNVIHLNSLKIIQICEAYPATKKIRISHH